MTHKEVWDLEMASLNSAKDARWNAFVKRVETLLQIKDLDGDQREDGYSLDFAYYAFIEGVTSEAYAFSVKKNQGKIDDDHKVNFQYHRLGRD